MRLIRTGFIVGLLAGVLAAGSAVAQRAAQPKAPGKGKDSTEAQAKALADAMSVEALTATALPSVVVIKHFGRDGKEDGVGAGFVISTDGLIATSLHVIGEARPIAVQFADGTQREVTEVYAWDRKFDLAIIRVAATKLPLPALVLGDSDTLKQGAAVMALGNPAGLRHSVVQGVLSARREVDGNEMLQVAIPIEPGNSGGPLLDMKGRVHGVLTLKSALTANLGFAMPSKLITALLDKPNPVPMSRWLTIGALNARDWKPVFGARWSQRAGRVQVEGAGQGFGGRSLCLSQKPVPARPYEISVEVRLDDESGAAGLVFASDGGDRHYGFYPSAGQVRLTRFDGPSVYSWNILKQMPTEHYQPGEWNRIRVRVEAGKILCFVNDQLVVESQDDGLKEGQAGLAKFRDTRAEFRNFRLGTNSQISVSMRDASTNAVALKERARAFEREAKELRREAAKLHRASVQGELLKVLGEPEAAIDLFHATLLIARLDNAELDIDPYRQQLAEMAREVTGKFSKDADAATKLAALKEYLFAENGFHGSRSDYSSRANSYMNQVLDDREGLPITLSVLFMELAQRIGVSGVDGLPLPGHFMVRYTPGNGPEQIIDAYNGGRTVSRTEAQERVIAATGEGFRDIDYRAATKREIILRMLRNLLGGIRADDASVDSLRYLDVILALAPDGVGDRLNRARLRMQMGNSAGAKEDFKWILDEQPAGVDLERVAELYRSL